MQIGPWFASCHFLSVNLQGIHYWLLRNWQCVLKVFYGLFNHKIIAVLWLVPIPQFTPPSPKEGSQTTKPNQQTNRNKETDANLISPTEFYARLYCSSLCLEWIRFVSSNKSCQHSISSGNCSVSAQSALVSDHGHPEQLYQNHLHVVEWTGTAFSGEEPKLLLVGMTLTFLLVIFFLKV